jgi:hypothetical protein
VFKHAVLDRFLSTSRTPRCSDSLTTEVSLAIGMMCAQRFIAIVTFSALPFARNAALLSQMEVNDRDAIATLGLVVKENWSIPTAGKAMPCASHAVRPGCRYFDGP